jgi:hypothetical protein
MGGHLYSPPLYNGGQLLCFNATTGDLVWSQLSFAITNSANGVLSDGYLVVPNAYNNELYCYNKGQSATTVSAPDIAIPQGNTVLIKGTVTDQSPGQTCLGIPAAGTPAISDASMTPWMEYLYDQQPEPQNATGVPVTLSVIDSNGNYRQIGTATSNTYGTFSLTWTPDIPGDYTIIASFAGSESYYPSSADATMYASTIPTAAPTSQPISLASTQTYIMAGVAAIIIVVVIVGAVLAMLMLRKRP